MPSLLNEGRQPVATIGGAGMRCLVVASQAAAGRLIAHQPAKAGRRFQSGRLRVRGPAPWVLVYPVCPANDANVVLDFAGNGFAAAPSGGCGLAGTHEQALLTRTGPLGAKPTSLSTSPEWEWWSKKAAAGGR